MSNLVHCVI